MKTLASPSTTAVNVLGLDLLRAGKPNENALISPYSIQCALAMAYAGADGVTKTEMAEALHYDSEDRELHLSFAASSESLGQVANERTSVPPRIKPSDSRDTILLMVANALFVQEGYHLLPGFLTLLEENYGAPLQELDFLHDPEGAIRNINEWVEEQTQNRIRDILSAGALSRLTRMVLVNAVYFKAPFSAPFPADCTMPLPFHLAGGETVTVQTMTNRHCFGYTKKPGMTVLRLPYEHCDWQFVIFLPDRYDGLQELAGRLSADSLTECRYLPAQELLLYLPRLKIEPPTVALGRTLRALGMRTAFDEPPGSANFERMAPCRSRGDHLYISEVFHKAFLNLDESGTEAAAATSVMLPIGFDPHTIRVHVNRPFIFALQHAPSGACLFLGRVADPR